MNQTNKPTICLNMIVKDESHIIKDTLTKLCSKIKFDRWIISDTGSTDNTPTIIEDFFEERGIEGKIYYDKWKNFSHNRTLALHHAFNLTDYLLVFDADDEIEGDLTLGFEGSPQKLTEDGYYFKFGCSINYYERILLVNNRKRWKYLSVLHEYIMCVDTPNYSKGKIEGNYTTISGRSGNRSKDPNKYYNDGQVLEKEYNRLTAEGEDPHSLRRRYAFYCANSYRDASRPELAVKWYKTTLTHDSWVQEKYVACIYLYDCYVKMGEKENGLYYLTEAIKYDPDRPEWIASLIRYCYDNGLFKLAMGYYSVFKDFFENKYIKGEIDMNSKLFLNGSEYDFHVPFNMIIACWNTKDFETGVKMFEILFMKKCVVYSKAQIECVIRNLEFFIEHVKDDENQYKSKFFKLANEYLKFMHSNNYANFNNIEWLKKYVGNDLDVSYIYPKKIPLEMLIKVDESQYSKNIPIKILNLKRRPDRRQEMENKLKAVGIANYEFIEAVDGKLLQPSLELKHLFRNNDFGYRRGVMGCALSHYKVIKQLINDQFNDYYLIMEDDATFCSNFSEKIEKLQFKDKELFFLGYLMFSKILETVSHLTNVEKDETEVIDFESGLFIGGAHCYSINKIGAQKIVNYIENSGMIRPIDHIIKDAPGIKIYETRPHLSFATWNEGGKIIDTDIQNRWDPMIFE